MVLRNELIQGRELTKQLEHQLHVAVSSSSSSHDQTQKFLIHKILDSYDKALSMVNAKSPVGDTDQDVTSGSTPGKRKMMPRWTEQVRVPPASNVNDDGFSWRKYGQKDIPGAKYPRGYYRCTYRNTRNCWATKQVQRSDDDPTVFEITHRGRHTCIDHPAAIIPPFPLPENQTDSNASIDAAPLQIREVAMCVSAATSGNNSQVTEKSVSNQPVASSVDTSINFSSGLCSFPAEDQKELEWLFGIDLLHTKAGYVTNEGSLLSDLTNEENATVSSKSEKLVAMQKQRAESDFVPMQSTRDTKTELFTSSHAAEDQKELKPFSGMDWLQATAGYVKNEVSLLSDVNEEENVMGSSEVEKLVAKQKQRAESDFVLLQSTRDTVTELFPSSHAAEDQKELKPFFGMDWLHTKAGYVTNKGSLLSNVKEEENATMSGEAEKLVAMQKHRAESDFVPMQSTRDTKTELFPSTHDAEDQKELKPLLGSDLLHTRAGYVMNEGSLLSDLKNEENAMGSSDFVPMQSTRDTDTELFPWMMKKDINPHAALGKLHWHSSHSESEFGSHCSESESEFGSHCSESESEDTDEKMKIGASPEYHWRETSESAVLQMRNTAEPEAEPFFLEVNEDTASDEVHSYSSEQESEVDSYCSGPKYEVGIKRRG